MENKHKTILIVGLGNPGEEYEKTRHNAGFMFLDKVMELYKFEITKQQGLSSKFNGKVTELSVDGQKVILLKPQTFMNKSGDSVRAVADYYEINPEDVILVHDDLDLKIGEYKIQMGKGPKVHNGVTSVESRLGTTQFLRVRIGIENRTPELRKYLKGEDYVLQKIKKDETELFDETLVTAAEDLFSNNVKKK